MSVQRKFVVSLIAFAMLGVLSWLTLSNDPMVIHDGALGIVITIRFRTAVLVILGIWTLLTGLAVLRAQREARSDAARRE